MMQANLLTHNILVERPLVEKLQRLNIEVLSSAKLLTMLPNKTSTIRSNESFLMF